MTMNGSADESAMGRINAARESAHWDQVLALLREHWNELVHQQPHALLDLLVTLPIDVMNKNTRLRLAEEHLRRTLQRPPVSRAYSDILTDDPDAAPVDRLAAHTGRITAARSAGRYEDAAKEADRAAAMLRGVPVEIIPSFANALPEFHYHWGVTYLLVARFADALEQFTQSRDWAASIGNHMVITRSTGAGALIHALHGRTRDAHTWLEKLPHMPDTGWWATEAGTPARIAEAIIHIERLNVDTARALLADIDITTALDYWGPYFAVRAFITPADHMEAQKLLAEFTSFVSSLAPEYAGVPLNAEYSALVRYLLHQTLRQPDQAHQALGPTNADATATLMRQVGTVLHARHLTHIGQDTAARRMILPLLHVDSSNPRILIAALLLAAETDTPPHRDNLLRRAVGLATWNTSYAALTYSPPHVRTTLTTLLRQHNEPHIANLLHTTTLPTAIPGALAGTIPGAHTLTPRETATIAAALTGLTNHQIAQQQHVSVNTIKTHLRNAYRKLGITHRTQLHHPHQPGHPPPTHT